MSKQYEIRADFDAQSIVIYQAYSAVIAVPAIKEQRFVSAVFIKPSFLWLMERIGKRLLINCD
jgi:hypothetical protein